MHVDGARQQPPVARRPMRTPIRRIAMLSESDRIGGAETMMLYLAEELRERGYEIHFVVPTNGGDGFLSTEGARRGFGSHKVRARRAVDPHMARELAALLRAERIDLVHAHMWVMSFYGAVAGLMAGVPHVVTMHGPEEQHRQLRRRLALRFALGRARGSVAVSDAMRDDFVRALGRAAATMRVIYNGVPDRRGERTRVRRELGLRDDELLVSAVGSLCPRKGHADLIEALALLPREIPWHVAIAGTPTGAEPDTTPDLQRIIAERGLAGRAHLLGPRSDVPDLLAASDVYAMPSLWEGHPMAMLEAMFAARPVVASRVGGIPEAVQDGTQALLAAPGDVPALAAQLGRLLTDAALRERLGAAGRARAESAYSVRAMADAYEALYHGDRPA